MSNNAAQVRGSRPSIGADTVPQHVAIVMDGNGRWARRRRLPRVAGHRAGLESVKEVLRVCGDRGIRVLTLFAFSSENWRRPADEVATLMSLFSSALEQQLDRFHEHQVRLRVIGDLSAFSSSLQAQIRQAEQSTAGYDGLHLQIAANYGGRWDITQAARKVVEAVERGELCASDVCETTVHQHLCMSELPEPDLFVRTGGETRISNFLLWQLAYTELYFTETLWPDFHRSQFEAALAAFGVRERRYGRTSEQVAGAEAPLGATAAVRSA
ncbi:MAG: polyprenyl diphosphate synthase [Gammaproteobacteria bacterium]